MRIHSVKMENFRGFRSFDQNLSPRLNVFIGKNGSGKTSVLDAISMNINHGIHRLTTSNPSGSFSPEHLLNQNDINNESTDCYNTLKYNIENIELEYSLKMNVFNKHFRYDGKEFEKYFTNLRTRLDNNTNLPTVVYYNADKDFKIDKTFNSLNDVRLPQLNAYKNASNKDAFSFKDFAIWFRLQEDIENEIRLKKDINYQSNTLMVFRFALIALFKNIGNEQFTELSIIRAKPDQGFNFIIESGGELFIKKNGNYLKINQLSSGEKNLIFLVCDLASRIAQLNPSLISEKNFSPELMLEKANGIVLIDEIELHLHPTWQRNIVRSLIKTFPNIQFVFTTHSENVIISILDLVKEKEILPTDVSVINLKPTNVSIESEKLEINDHGQIEGGLSSFYEDQLEDIDQFFNI